MDTKPIRRNINLLQLSKDHHLSLLFCWKIRQGIKKNADKDRMIQYVSYFWSHHMEQHFREEEEILFQPLQDDKVKRAIEEHRQIRSAVTDLIDHPVKNNTTTELSVLADKVDQHVRYEERTLFPHLEKNLSDAQLVAIGSALKEQPLLPDVYEDEFWK
jgi:hemerythrin-like domain-containing protein